MAAPTSRPEPRYGMPSFQQVLQSVSDAYRNRRERGRGAGAERRCSPQRLDPGQRRAADLGPVRSNARIEQVRDQAACSSTSTTTMAALAAQPKFPQPMTFGLRPHAISAHGRPDRALHGRAHAAADGAAAASMTSWAAASTATASTRRGRCPTSRRCSTTTPSCCAAICMPG